MHVLYLTYSSRQGVVCHITNNDVARGNQDNTVGRVNITVSVTHARVLFDNFASPTPLELQSVLRRTYYLVYLYLHMSMHTFQVSHFSESVINVYACHVD